MKEKILSLLVGLMALVLLVPGVKAQSATLISDQPDYLPGTTATFTGSGFLPGEVVKVQVLHYDGTSNDGEDHQPWEVTADVNGNFETTWYVCEDDCLGATLRATADGLTSLRNAEVIFTDTAFTSAAPGRWNNVDTWVAVARLGNLTATLGSPHIEGFGTSFLDELEVGDKIFRSNGTALIGTVLTITSNTSLTLESNAVNSNSTSYSAKKIPGWADAVTIAARHHIVIDAPASCLTLKLNNSNANHSYTSNANTSLTVNSGQLFIIGGGIGTITIGSGTTMSGGAVNSTFIGVKGTLLSGSIHQLPGAKTSSPIGRGFTYLIINQTGIVTVTGDVTGTTIPLTDGNYSSATVQFPEAGGVLNLTGSFTTTEFTHGTNSTVNYNNEGSQPIRRGSYSNLSLSGSGIKSTSGVTTVTGQLSINAGVVANLGASSHSAGTLKLGGNGTAAGTWGSTSSIPLAAHTNNTYFAASTGKITVATGTCSNPSPPIAGSNTFVYDGTAKTATANVEPGETVTWYATATGPQITTAPAGVNAGSYSAYAEATNGCTSLTRTLITLVINKAPLTITADSKELAYGDNATDFTYTISGFANDETASVTSGQASVSALYNNFTPVSASPVIINITPGTLSAANYSFTNLNDGQLIINKRSLFITANNDHREYGEDNPLLTGSLSGQQNGETFNESYSTIAVKTSTIGDYEILPQLSGNNLSNYNLISINGQLHVDKATLRIIVENQTREYGNENPATTVVIAGQKNSETFTNSYTTIATKLSPIGDYNIVPRVSGITLSNYSVVSVNGKLHIDKAVLKIAAADQGREYGEANPFLTGNVTGQKNSETFTEYYTTTAVGTSPIGDYEILPELRGETLPNYTVVLQIGKLHINEATLTITAADQTREYGDVNPILVGILTGIKNNESFTETYRTGATQTSSVGEYNIFPELNGPTLSNYTIIPVNGTLTVTKATLTITAADKSREYGEANPAFTGSFNGQKNSEIFTVGGTTTATATSGVGDYEIVPSVTGITLDNYDVTAVNRTLTVTKATLIVSAPSLSLLCGQAIIIPTNGTFNGAKNNETFIVSGTTAATILSGPGTYPITQTVSGPTLNNYNIIGNAGTLTISGVNIDANANVTPKPVSTTTATLVAIKVTNTAGTAAPGVSVTLYVDDKTGISESTDATGIATFNLGVLATDVYRLRAVAGSGCTETTAYMPIYDPSGGFITGGGWINSPIYSTLDYMKVNGKANFGFVSKYEKGKTIPSGNTEFQFKEGGMNFTSSSFDWLVISGNKAQYKGTGTINGSGSFGFILTASDGDLSAVKSADLFRIKIYDKLTNRIVYDNQYGSGTTPDDADPTTALGGGSIVIHEVKSGKLASIAPLSEKSAGLNMTIVEPILNQKIKLFAYPNPFGKQATISFTLPTDEPIVLLDVYDLKGSRIKRMYQGKAAANQTLEFDFNGNYLAPGTYLLRLTTSDKSENFKMIMTE